MKVGIAGLGLIGGSLAKAYERSGAEVFGYDGNRVVQETAKRQGTLVGDLDEHTVKECGLLLIALYPQVSIEYLNHIAPYVPETTLVMDCCGVKRELCKVGFALAEEYGFTFVGGHPMAGTQYSGYANSRANMFEGAPMVAVPKNLNDKPLLDRVKKLLTPAGFGSLTVTTAEHHDEMIAYTSQMCHVISNAYVKSPRAQMHKGYSAGSYLDLTRVAWLNEHMWTDLFLENRDYLLQELDEMIGHLQEYRAALEQGNGDRLCTLLAEGRICKEKVDAE